MIEMQNTKWPDNPKICKVCGTPTDGFVTINNKGICHRCWIELNLTEEVGADPWDMLED